MSSDRPYKYQTLTEMVEEAEREICPRCDGIQQMSFMEDLFQHKCKCEKFCGSRGCSGPKPKPPEQPPHDGWAQADDAWKGD